MSWKDKYVDSHSCEKLLENKMSVIRKYNSNNVSIWVLFRKEYNSDYDSYFLAEIGEIEYCPFCGERLD